MYISPEIIAAAGGGALLVGFVSWRLAARRQPVKMLRRALCDPDAATRRAAITIAAERGLRPFVDLLVERAASEHDPSVRRELAEAVVRNQWEPTDRRGLLELRLWAQTQLSAADPHSRANPTGTNGTNGAMGANGGVRATGAAAGLGVASAGASASLDGMGLRYPPGRAESSPAASPERNKAAAATLGWAPARAPNPTRTGNGGNAVSAVLTKTSTRTPPPAVIKAVVTGAGGPAGIAVVRALQKAGHEVVAVDADSLAAGLRLAPQAAVIPRSDDPMLARVVTQIAAATEANLLIPTVAEEIPPLVEASDELRKAGLRFWLPDVRAVHTCLDKWEFAQFATENGIPVPATALGSARGVPGAWVVKPRFGRGSRHVHLVERHDDLAWHLQQVPEPIVQTRLEGREFTVDALVDRKGRLVGAAPRWRLAVTGGISVRGRTFEDEGLVAAVSHVLSRLGLCGPSNVQGVMSVDGTPVFIEVNPRFSGGLPLSLAAGADFVGEYLRAVLGKPIQAERLRARPGVTMIRHFEELFE